jgi:hypothetical protein
MYGKSFDSKYTGSMVGKGFASFALLDYVIANMKPDKTVGFQVDLNSKILATVFGEPEESVVKAIEFLCAPDPKSRTTTEEGRRLVQVGTFSYRVVNGVKYDKIRNEEDRREQNRVAQQRHREKTKKPSNPMKKMSKVGTPLKGEVRAVKDFADGKVDKNFQPIVPEGT